MIKRGVIWALIMVFLCSSFIFATEFVRRPGVDGMCKHILLLPGYEGAQLITELPGAYSDIEALGVKDIRVYKMNDGTSKEFAVIWLKDKDSLDQNVIELLQKRKEELKNAFDGNDVETERIDRSRIIEGNDFMVYIVYDTEGDANEAVYKYFVQR
ncbi:MAG: DUF4358 domain-containing protein [Eubacteriales bacterium]|nr:DUF4358 domain-containing protein [Eubacteriales bacterium]